MLVRIAEACSNHRVRKRREAIDLSRCRSSYLFRVTRRFNLSTGHVDLSNKGRNISRNVVFLLSIRPNLPCRFNPIGMLYGIGLPCLTIFSRDNGIDKDNFQTGLLSRVTGIYFILWHGHKGKGEVVHLCMRGEFIRQIDQCIRQGGYLKL